MTPSIFMGYGRSAVFGVPTHAEAFFPSKRLEKGIDLFLGFFVQIANGLGGQK